MHNNLQTSLKKKERFVLRSNLKRPILNKKEAEQASGKA